MKDFMTQMRSPSPDQPIWPSPAFIPTHIPAHHHQPPQFVLSTADSADPGSAQDPFHNPAAGLDSPVQNTGVARPTTQPTATSQAHPAAAQAAAEAHRGAVLPAQATVQHAAATGEQQSASAVHQEAKQGDEAAPTSDTGTSVGQTDANTSPVRVSTSMVTDDRSTQTTRSHARLRHLTRVGPGLNPVVPNDSSFAQPGAGQTPLTPSQIPRKPAHPSLGTDYPFQHRVDLPSAAIAPGFPWGTPAERLQAFAAPTQQPGRFSEQSIAELRQAPGTLLGSDVGVGAQQLQPATHPLQALAHQLPLAADHLQRDASQLPSSALSMPLPAHQNPWGAFSSAVRTEPPPVTGEDFLHMQSAVPEVAALAPQSANDPSQANNPLQGLQPHLSQHHRSRDLPQPATEQLQFQVNGHTAAERYPIHTAELTASTAYAQHADVTDKSSQSHPTADLSTTQQEMSSQAAAPMSSGMTDASMHPLPPAVQQLALQHSTAGQYPEAQAQRMQSAQGAPAFYTGVEQLPAPQQPLTHAVMQGPAVSSAHPVQAPSSLNSQTSETGQQVLPGTGGPAANPGWYGHAGQNNTGLGTALQGHAQGYISSGTAARFSQQQSLSHSTLQASAVSRHRFAPDSEQQHAPSRGQLLQHTPVGGQRAVGFYGLEHFARTGTFADSLPGLTSRSTAVQLAG